MNEKANNFNPKAEAARAERQLVRSRSRRRVAFSSFALFAVVFSLLSFRLTTGLDPSVGNTIATTNTPSAVVASGGDDNESSGVSEDDSVTVSDTQASNTSAASSSAASTTSSQTTSPAPTTKAS